MEHPFHAYDRPRQTAPVPAYDAEKEIRKEQRRLFRKQEKLLKELQQEIRLRLLEFELDLLAASASRSHQKIAKLQLQVREFEARHKRELDEVWNGIAANATPNYVTETDGGGNVRYVHSSERMSGLGSGPFKPSGP
jgi:hypothetical protein